MKLEELETYQPLKPSPSNFKDLTGFENDYFKVISRAPNSKSKTTRWNCLCKACGEYCVKDTANLKIHKSCGCQKNSNIGKALRKDLTGQRFGNLVAINYAGKSNASGNAIWICRCDCGNICEVASNNLIAKHTTSCGCINYSIGAKMIEEILQNNNIKFYTEYSIKEIYFKNKDHPARFDFALYNDNNEIIRFIEYDGIQHYLTTWGVWAGHVTLEEQQRRDKIKNEYAISHNIPLVRIPYWERDNITLDLLLGDKYLISN